MIVQFNDLLVKIECSEHQYLQYKELFDKATETGLISQPLKYEKYVISHATGTDIQYWYRWTVLDK